MSLRLPRILILSAAAALAVGSAVSSSAAAAPLVQHCISEPTADGSTPTMQCFSTFAAAMSAATGGAAVSSSAQSSSVVRPLTNVVIGVDYSGTSFTGSSLTWFEASGCGSYSASSMPTGWNDAVESVSNSSGCGSSLYQNASFGGTKVSVGVNSSATTLGSFNNTASSQKWCTSSSC